MIIPGFPHIIRPKEPLECWGSISDVQYALRVNADRIFGINPDSIILAMPMWKGAGNVIIDYSKYGNYGTNYGATWTGQGLDFDGIDDYVNCGNPSGIMSTTELTVIVRFIWKGTSITAQQRIFSKGAYYSVSAAFGIRYTPINERIQISVKRCYYWQAGLITQNEPAFVALSYKKDNFGKAYFNRAEIGDFDINNVDIPLASHNIMISSESDADNIINSIHKTVGIFNIALTADQIALMYELPYALYQPVARVFYSIPIGAIMNQFQKSNLGADLFDGALL